MGWIVVEDVEAFDAAVRPFLETDPVEQTLLLTIIEVLRRRLSFGAGDVLFAANDDGGAAIRTPPYGLHIAPGSQDIPGLAELVADRDFPGVNGTEADVLAFAEARGPYRVEGRNHLLVLGDLIPPPPPAGRVRALDPDDLDLACELLDAFTADAGEIPVPRARVAAGLEAGRSFGWDLDGDVVAYAGYSPVVAGVARIAPVYTRPAHRRRGYGAAITAAATLAALHGGAERMCLFTDAANPTANGVYERLGYVRSPSDRLLIEFD